jgi:hypothetical protein
MSIATAIQNAQAKVAAAYTSCNAKGATMPATQDLAHLDDCIDSIPTGGSSGPVSDDADILFIDIDGQNLYGYTRAEALLLTELPPLPSRDGLVCEGWNWTLQEIKDQCNAHMRATIGPMYHTVSGKEEFVYMNYVEFIVKGAAAEINWGDGSAVQSAAVDETVTHTTTKNGRVRASISFADGTGYIQKVGTNINTLDAVYILEYYCSGNYKSPVNALDSCELFGISGLNFATWSSGNLTLRHLGVRALIIPHWVTGASVPFAQNENYVRKVSQPGNMNVRQFPYMNRFLSRFDIPVNTGDNYVGEMLYRTRALSLIDIPATFTSGIGSTTFASSPESNSPKIFVFRRTTPYNIGSTTFNAHARIFVPYSADHSVLNAYKGATNWVNYASQIYELTADGDIPATLPTT